jgi:L-ascorbate metabolism protein UlaG (beta-lactamase superfamily)
MSHGCPCARCCYVVEHCRTRPICPESGSADLNDSELRDGPVDVFLAGVAGRSVTPRYWERILPKLDPRIVVPTHDDNFFSPLGRPQDFVRRVQLAEVPHEVRQVARDAQVLALPRVDA